ncbi:MAG: copper transporter, partial [Microlunatus sp.]|nr:copper transporter [Microlunatus sp.]
MITPRYHAISLVAVFLALTFGVVLGSGLLSGPLLSGLQAEKQDLHAQIDALHDQQRGLNEKLSTANGFDAQLAGRIVRDVLPGKSVVIFRTPDALDEDVDAVARLVGQGGGTVAGTVALTPQFVDGNSAEKLRVVVESGIV